MERFGEKQIFRKLIFRFLEVKSFFFQTRGFATHRNSGHSPLAIIQFMSRSWRSWPWTIVGGKLWVDIWTIEDEIFSVAVSVSLAGEVFLR